MSTVTELERQIANLRTTIARQQSEIAAATAQGNIVFAESARTALAESFAELATLQAELNAAQINGSLPTASVGQVAQDSDTASSQNPPGATVTVGANGRINNGANNNTVANSSYVGVDGTAGQTLSTTTSQATPPVDLSKIPITATSQQVLTADQVNRAAGVAPQTPGVAAPRDDNTKPNTNTTQQTVNSTFGAPIIPQANILDQYVSYTYSISWYLITPNQFKALATSKNTAGWQLLMQSGGAGVTAPQSNAPGRNQYFSLDYYLDNLTIHSKAMKGTGMAHNATEISFTVTEPNGITLIQSLYNAVSNLWKNNPTQYAPNAAPNYISNPYCLVINFYGYDENGNLVTIGKNSSTGKSAIVQKFYPFLLTDLTFRVANKVIEYSIKAKPLPYTLNLSQARGTIPFNYELVGTTVDEVLNGRAVTSTAPTDPGRATSPQPQTTAPSVVGNTISSNSTNTSSGSNPLVTDTGVDFGQLSG
jgi:hypothetical protein